MLDCFLVRDIGPLSFGQDSPLFLRVDLFLGYELLVLVLLLMLLLMLRFGGVMLFHSGNFLVMFLGKLFDVLFLFFFVVKVVPAHERIRLSPSLRLFMLCFHEARGQCRQFLFAEAGCAVAHFTLPFFFLNFLGRSRRSLGTVHGCFPSFLYPSRLALGLVVRQNPMR